MNSRGDKDMTFMMPVFLDTNEINNLPRWLFESRKFHLEDLPGKSHEVRLILML